MHCTVRSADRTLYEGDVHRVVARSPHGEFAVMDHHAPLLAVLASGIVRLHTADAEELRFVCSSGTFDFADNRATLLVERPVRVGEIDADDVRHRLDVLRSEASTGDTPSDEVAYLELLLRAKEKHA